VRFTFLIHAEVYDKDFNRIKHQPIKVNISAKTPEIAAKKLARAFERLASQKS
jgi:hypothetical protein